MTIEHLSIYLDESGDLGFDWSKPKTSRYFVVTLLACNSLAATSAIKLAIRRTLKKKLNHSKNKRRKINELKGSATTFQIKKYFYQHVPDQGWHLYTLALSKEKVLPHLQTKIGKKKLYNFLARFLLERVHFEPTLKTVNLVLDKCKNIEEIKDFNSYVQTQLEALLPLNVRLDISHESSQANPVLQAADLFCWGIYRKVTFTDLE